MLRTRHGPVQALAVLLPCLLALAVSGCRQKMADQPYYKALDPSTVFADNRSERPVVENTVARGRMRDDSILFTGMVNRDPVSTLPVALTPELLRRGRERFNIYCATCHGLAGNGDGMIVQRGYPRPTAYTDDRLLTSPIGHFYDTMTNGWARMPAYRELIGVHDRWAIAAYVRVLQLSQHARLEDVPEAERRRLIALADNQTSNAGGR